MTIASAASLLDVLRRHHVLTAGQLAEVEKLQRQIPDPRQLARELLQRGWLTPFQLNQLFQGRAADLVLGQHVLLERLGEGGMGQVFKARHARLDRVVALKVIRKDRLVHKGALSRFQREARAAARLSHPNIVSVFDADEVAGTHFLVMEYVEGVDLSRYVKQHGPLPVDLAVSCIRQAALGLQHAYERGLVHRDIKPANLLLTRAGQVKILDMGLARVDQVAEDDSSTLTQEGSVMGSLDYIAPEQAKDSHQADIRSDLYSLGCSLYYLLSGRVPFPGGTAMEKLLKHGTETATPIATLRPDLPAWLAAVTSRLMAKRPEDRFQTPAELIHALDAKIDPMGQHVPIPTALPLAIAIDAPTDVDVPLAIPAEGPLSTASTSTWSARRLATATRVVGYRTWQWCWRHPRSSGTVAACFALLALLWWNGVFSRPKSPPDPTPTPVVKELPPGKQLSALALVSEPKGIEGATGWTLETVQHRGKILAMAASPDGRWLATAGEDGAIRIREFGKSAVDRIFLGHDATIQALDYSPDGRLLASGAADNLIRIWEADSGKLLHTLDKHKNWIASLDFSSDSKSLASSGIDGEVFIWDLANQRPRSIQPATGRFVNIPHVAWQPGSNTLAVGVWTHGDLVHLFDAATGEERQTIAPREMPKFPAGIWSLAWSPDGRTLAIGEYYQFWIWDDKTQSLSGPYVNPARDTHRGPIRNFAWHPQAKTRHVAVAFGFGHNVAVFNVDSETFPYSSRAVGNDTFACAWSANGSTIACAAEGLLTFWKVEENQYTPLPWHPAIGNIVTRFDQGKSLSTAVYDGTLYFWNAETGAQIHACINRYRHTVSPDGRWALYWVDYIPGAELVEAKKCSGGSQLTGEAVGQLDAAVWSPNGQVLATYSRDQTIRLWRVPTNLDKPVQVIDEGRPVRDPNRSYSPILVWSKRSDYLAVAGVDHVVRVYAAGSGKLVARLEHDSRSFVTCVCFSPNGEQIATGGSSYNVHLWNRQDAKLRRTFAREHRGTIQGIDWTADGELIASCATDGTVRIWSANNGEVRLRLEIGNNIRHVGWLNDYTTLFTAGDSALRFHDASTGRLLGTAIPFGRKFFNENPTGDLASLFIAGNGHYRAHGAADDELVYVVQSESGQRLYSPREFRSKFGWKNDRAKAVVVKK
jgi:WD40 repeat protein/serine/threonine protein kinase